MLSLARRSPDLILFILVTTLKIAKKNQGWAGFITVWVLLIKNIRSPPLLLQNCTNITVVEVANHIGWQNVGEPAKGKEPVLSGCGDRHHPRMVTIINTIAVGRRC